MDVHTPRLLDFGFRSKRLMRLMELIQIPGKHQSRKGHCADVLRLIQLIELCNLYFNVNQREEKNSVKHRYNCISFNAIAQLYTYY
jgi:hypothetical protein